jgi:hypothetical protein
MQNDFKKQLIEEVKKRGVIKEQKEETSDFKMMISKLFHSETQVHMFHLQTKSQSSFAEHMALGGYYDEIGDKLDSLIESYQGKYDLIKGYKAFKFEDYEGSEQLITYFNDLVKMIGEHRKSIKESYLQNQIDGIEELIYSTLYKLKNLK